MSQLVIHKRAAKYLSSLPQPDKERVRSALIRLAAAPLTIQVSFRWPEIGQAIIEFVLVKYALFFGLMRKQKLYTLTTLGQEVTSINSKL